MPQKLRQLMCAIFGKRSHRPYWPTVPQRLTTPRLTAHVMYDAFVCLIFLLLMSYWTYVGFG